MSTTVRDLTLLDNMEVQAKLDKDGMLASIRDLPSQCRRAWREAQALRLGPEYQAVEKVVILGMGGSAIAGDYLRVLLEQRSQVPVFNHRDYGLPLHVDERSLIIASSYSGNTEETLSAFAEALKTGAPMAVITTGGRLLDAARTNEVPAFTYCYRSQPRAAFGYSLMPLLAIAQKVGIIDGLSRDVETAISAMELMQSDIDAAVPRNRNSAKQLAESLFGRLPVIYGAGHLKEVAHRWKTQFNESSKMWSFYESLPEANHNALEGYTHTEEIAQQATVVFLWSASLSRQVALRYDFTQRALERAGATFEVATATGEGVLAEMLTATLLGDYVSYYLAVLNGVAPAPTQTMDQLKRHLSSG